MSLPPPLFCSLSLTLQIALDDADESPAPAPTPKVAAAKPVPAAAAKPAAKPARGDYPARGRPAKVFQGDREVNTEGPSTIENGKEDRGTLDFENFLWRCQV